MPKFTIERAFDVPHYRHETYEAETLADAIALDNANDDWEHQKEDFDCSGDERITGIWAGDRDYVGENLNPVAPSPDWRAIASDLAGALDACILQLNQMKGMFPGEAQEDAEQALNDADEAIEAYHKAMA